MPLSAANFVPEGTNAHTDHLQFYQLLTGVMADQPVTIANTLSATALVSTGGGISAPSGTAIVFSTGGAARWTILNTGQLETSVDGAVNIGSTVSGRPNNIYITGALSVGSTNDRLRTPNSGTDFNLETASGTLTLAGLAASYSCANAYYDGTNWQRLNVADGAFLAGVNQNDFIVDYAAAAANPITWVGILTLDHAGNLYVAGALTTSSISTTVINFPNGGYIQSYTTAPYVQINQLTVTPGITSLAGLQVNGTAAISSTVTIGGVLYCAQPIDVANTSVQRVATYYGINNSTYLTNDGTNWTFTGALTVSAGLYVNANIIYFSGGSYYLQQSSNQLNVVGMNLLSWGWVGFNANAGINISHNGTNFITTHNLIVPSYYYFVNNTVATFWNGAQICFTHSLIVATGYVYLTSTAVAMYWNGQGIQSSHVFYSAGLFNSSRIYTNGWDLGWANNLGGNVACSGMANIYGQVTAYQSYNNSNLNCFLAPNAANYTGEGLAYAWQTWACVDHAVEYGLRLERISDPLCYVRHITGWSYDHAWMQSGNQRPQRDEAGEILFTPSFGFKASEVAQYLPELVGFNLETGEPESVDLDRMGVVLWEAFKQHAARTDARLEQLERSL